MLLHFEILAIASFLAKIHDLVKNKKIRFVLSLLLTLGLSAFIGYRRLDMGIDTYTYFHMYQRNQFKFDYTEIGFPVLLWISRKFGLEYSQFFFLLAFITMVGFVLFVLKEIEINHPLYIFLYITSFSFLYCTSAVRFFLAMSFGIIAMYYFSLGKIKTSIVFFAIGTMFHFTLLIMVPVFLLAKIKSFHRYIVVLFWLGVIFAISNLTITLVRGVIPAKYAYIFQKAGNSIGISTIKMFLEFYIFYIFRNKIKNNRELYFFILKILGFSIIYDIFPLAYRSIWYFKFPVWFLWPILIDNLKKSKDKVDQNNALIIGSLLVIIYIVYYYYMLKTNGVRQNLVPYHFVNDFLIN